MRDRPIALVAGAGFAAAALTAIAQDDGFFSGPSNADREAMHRREMREANPPTDSESRQVRRARERAAKKRNRP